MKTEQFSLSIDQTIRDAIIKISQNLSRCVIVTSGDELVVGVLSEGDIIRALTNDISVYAPVRKIAQPAFKYLNEVDMQAALRLVRGQPGITLIPVVSSNFELREVITIHDVMDYVAKQLQID
jgi:CBS domain-containing protein